MELPFVSVIIPVYNDWDRLKHCLNALFKQVYPINRFEVLIVNNNPHDPPPYPVVSKNVYLVTESKPGSYSARNAGIKLARGDIFAFTDSDCIPHHEWLTNAIGLMAKGYDRIAGHVELFCSSKCPKLAEAYELVFAFNQSRNALNGVSVTANLIASRECFEKTGLFDESLFSGGDFEWAIRATSRGLNILYAPNVVVRHPARNSLSALLQKNRRVAGGGHLTLTLHKHLFSSIRDWTPPMQDFLSILRSPIISIKYKPALMVLRYFFKLHSHYVSCRINSGISAPSRL